MPYRTPFGRNLDLDSKSQELLADLEQLRKGRGVLERDLRRRVGTHIRYLCGVLDDDDQSQLRAKIVTVLIDLSRRLPDDQRLAVVAALALHPDAQQRFLGERIDWLAERLGRDQRTARRRVDEGLDRLAEIASGHDSFSAESANQAWPDAWHVRSCRTLLRLDAPTPELLEERTVVFTRDGVKEIIASVSLPRHATRPSGEHDLQAQVLYGGRLLRAERVSDTHFRFFVGLPTTFRAGQAHDYATLFRIPDGQPMRPHYAFIPLHSCSAFDLRVKFNPSALPTAIWRLDGVPPRVLDDYRPTDKLLHVDAVGELRLEFHELSRGLAYGAQWVI